MVKLITAEEAKILNEMRENLNKIYRTLNKTIREDALDGKNEIDYSLSPYLFKNHEILIGILRDSLIEAGYHVEITNSKEFTEDQLNFFDTDDIVQILMDEIKPAIVRNLRIRTSESRSRLYYGNKLFTGEITLAIPKD